MSPAKKTLEKKSDALWCEIGCHVSSAGGLFNAPINAKALQCETFQMFSRPPQGGTASKITPDLVDQFKAEMQSANITTFVIHAPYIINFGSAKPSTFHGSINLVLEELRRGALIGAKFVMFHPGSFKDLGYEEGVKQVRKGLLEILEKYEGDTQLLIEVSAGAGEVIGDTFNEVAAISEPLWDFKTFGGICFDTQHAFASGYDLRTEDTIKSVFKEFDKELGLSTLRMSHVNDSKIELGGRKDRHEHIGDGHIGTSGFEHLLRFFKSKKLNIPLILETEHDKVALDLEVLKKLRDKIQKN